MKKSELKELLKYTGEMDALLGMKDYTFNEGKAKGVRAIDVKNGKNLDMTVLADKCLDIARLTYKGMNVGFAGKTGIVHPAYYVEEGVRGFLKTFNAGFLTTCGITYSGAPSEVDGRAYGLHGVMGNTPAENVNKETVYDGDNAMLKITGEMREACIFGENMRLEREIIVDTESDTIYINDTVKNIGYERQRLMNLYHINFGYPFLNDGAKVHVSPKNCSPRDAEAEKGVDAWDVMEAAQIGYEEQCFIHVDDSPNADSFAMLVTSCGKYAVIVHYDQNQCPLLCEWKCMRAGDYALGLEPTSCGFWGVESATEKGLMRYAEPGGEYKFNFKIELTDDKAVINDYIAKSSKP